MDPIADARREVALEIQKLAEDFERDDEAAFRRTRIACWVVVAVVAIIILGLLVLGGDARYLGVFWLSIVGLTWARLRALQPPPAAADRASRPGGGRTRPVHSGPPRV